MCKIINFYANFFFLSSGPLPPHGSSAHRSSEKGGLKAVYICACVWFIEKSGDSSATQLRNTEAFFLNKQKKFY